MIAAQPGAAPDRFARHLAQKFLGSNALAAGDAPPVGAPAGRSV